MLDWVLVFCEVLVRCGGIGVIFFECYYGVWSVGVGDNDEFL